jgi:hypothetical protein
LNMSTHYTPTPTPTEQAVFWFLVMVAIGCILTAALPGCTAAQHAEALAAHNAACVPFLSSDTEFNAAAVRHGIDPTAAAQSICAVPNLAAKLIEGDK